MIFEILFVAALIIAILAALGVTLLGGATYIVLAVLLGVAAVFRYIPQLKSRG